MPRASLRRPARGPGRAPTDSSRLLGVGAAPALDGNLLAAKERARSHRGARFALVELAVAAQLAGHELGKLRLVGTRCVGNVAQRNGLRILFVEHRCIGAKRFTTSDENGPRTGSQANEMTT